jgi:hypothetical protein
MTDMARGHYSPVWTGLTGTIRRVLEQITRRRGRPPAAGVREPRRPKPGPPALAVALDEPRSGLHRWIKLIGRDGRDPV